MSYIGSAPVYCAKCDKVIEAHKVGWFGQCTDCGDMTFGSKKMYEEYRDSRNNKALPPEGPYYDKQRGYYGFVYNGKDYPNYKDEAARDKAYERKSGK